MMLFYLMLGLASHGMDLGFLGFGLLGLWALSSLYFMSSFNTNSVVRVPMSDLSTLSSGTSVHPGD